jgi:hypothetical protein
MLGAPPSLAGGVRRPRAHLDAVADSDGRGRLEESGNIDAHLNDSRECQEEAHPSPDESERRGVTYVQAHPGPNRS